MNSLVAAPGGASFLNPEQHPVGAANPRRGAGEEKERRSGRRTENRRSPFRAAPEKGEDQGISLGPPASEAEKLIGR